MFRLSAAALGKRIWQKSAQTDIELLAEERQEHLSSGITWPKWIQIGREGRMSCRAKRAHLRKLVSCPSAYLDGDETARRIGQQAADYCGSRQTRGNKKRGARLSFFVALISTASRSETPSWSSSSPLPPPPPPVSFAKQNNISTRIKVR